MGTTPTAGRVAPPVGQGLIATKLTRPPLRTGHIARQRLMDALTAGRESRMTLVAAPTGYGKTTLVAAWCAELAERGDRAVAWLSLTATENDPVLLTRYLIAAMRGAGASIGEGPETMLRVPGASPTAWMRALVNDLATGSTEMTLVLDDYHVVTEPACHLVLQFLIDHAPGSLRLIVCSREDPPLALGSLRAAGQLAEVRASDLRFTVHEVAAMLEETDGLDLDHDSVVSLTGRHLVAYLKEAVLGGLDGDVREFLLATSIVDRVCTSLCEAITEMPAARMFDNIERSDLFLVSLDESRRWYRYHQLFGEMLRSELPRQHPDLVAVLHRRASAWYRERGLISEAIEHATAANDYADAAALISEHWLAIGRWGQEATIKRWLEAFGREELVRYPELGLVGAFLTGVSGGTEREFRSWLEIAEQGLAPVDDGATTAAGTTSLRAGVSLLHSAFGYRNVSLAAAAAARTARAQSESAGVFRVVALANLAFLLYVSGDLARARSALSEAMRDPQAQRRPYGFITALTTAAQRSTASSPSPPVTKPSLAPSSWISSERLARY